MVFPISPRSTGALAGYLTFAGMTCITHTTTRIRRLPYGVVMSVVALALMPGCGPDAAGPAKTSTGPATTTSVSLAAPPPSTPAPRTAKWVDLAVGDCLVGIPRVDLGELMATIVDCASSHQAEVFARAAMWVDSTVPDFANRACTAEFPKYTGRPVAGTPYAVSYLVDADQDRTGNDPRAPGTAICLLADANGAALTKSARG